MNQGQQVNVEDLSREDLVRIVLRDQGVKRELHGRIGALMGENVELLIVINELQQANQALQPNPSADEQLQFPSE